MSIEWISAHGGHILLVNGDLVGMVRPNGSTWRTDYRKRRGEPWTPGTKGDDLDAARAIVEAKLRTWGVLSEVAP